MPHISDGFVTVSGPNAYARYCELRQAERQTEKKRQMTRKLINYIALFVPIALMLLIVPALCHSTEWQWDGIVNKYDFYPAHAFVTSGEVPDSVLNELREIPGVESASLVYQPKYDETWVTILKVDSFDWELIDAAVAAVMGANKTGE